MTSTRIALLAGIVLLGACVPRPSAPPQPDQPPAQAPPPQPVPAPPSAPAVTDWRDVPLTRGAWTYRDDPSASQALFGPSESEPSFVVRCDRQSRRILLSRAGITSGNTMTVRTSFSARNFPLSVDTEPQSYVYTLVAAADPFLDGMAFSRGRFSVEVPGQPMLVIPAWPEPARVVEDCRT